MGLFGSKNEKEITLTIEGMHCNMCAANLERELKQTPGVKRAEVSFENKSAQVVYDEKKTDLQKISSAVEQAGYHVV